MAEIKFPRDFSFNGELPIPLGRLLIGDHVMRLMFCPDGKTRALISSAAVDDGSLIVSPKIPENTLFGVDKDG